ncbi:MAG: cytochrome P450 [Deltaproteobacteria bacterium]|nr:cytochrome P450 [Deltaproteobacteria bacterium]
MSVDPNVDYLNALSWDESMPERAAWLRDNAPVYWAEKSDLFVISRFEDVVAVSKDQKLFTSGQGVRPGNPAKIGLIDEEEPRHSQLRKLINKGFTPRMVKVWEEKFRQITTETLDAIAEKGECDFVSDIAVPLPLLLIAEMIGIRREDRERFHEWSDAMIAADGNFDKPEIVAKAGKAFFEYTTYVKEIIAERRKEPKDDFVSILVHADDEGILGRFERHSEIEGFDESAHIESATTELIMLLVLLMVAGNETTRNAISGGMQALIENPEQREKLLADPSLLASATEEMVRYVTPVHSFGRTVTRDTELHGVPIKEGQKVFILYTSANRDERQFENPDTFDITRNPHHVGFGIGNHFCLGANLARMEIRVAFEEILRRFPDMEFADGGPIVKPSSLVRTCAQMNVRYTPESRAV